MPFSSKHVLAEFKRLHREYAGADRPVSIAKVTRTGGRPLRPQESSVVDTTVTIPPIVTTTPKDELLAGLGRALGHDEKIFVFHPEAVVDRDPISTLGARFEREMGEVAKAGGIRYGDVLYKITKIYPAKTIVGVVPQWAVVGEASKPVGSAS